MHSTDDTVKIAKQFTDKIFPHEDIGYADPARNFALSKASHDWILVIDADEVVTDQLQEIILMTINQDSAADVYYLPRKNLVFDEWILQTGWWPDYQPRLFKKDQVSWQKGVHRQPDVKGRAEQFPKEERYALLHYNYVSVGQFIDKLNHYTTIQAQERQEKRPEINFSTQELMENFAGEFAKRALAQAGVEDGLHGISLSLLQAMYEATIYLKQWENQGFPQVSTAKFGETLQEMQKIWGYWWADYNVRRSRGLAKIYWQFRRKFKI
jgi:glycosyltransferase involved in cell wall biosynthesis